MCSQNGGATLCDLYTGACTVQVCSLLSNLLVALQVDTRHWWRLGTYLPPANSTSTTTDTYRSWREMLMCDGISRDVRKGAEGAPPWGFRALRSEGPRGPNSCEGIRNPHRSDEICAETHQKKHVRTVEGPLTIWVYLKMGPPEKQGLS